MKVARRISLTSGIVVALALFIITFIQHPTTNLATLLGVLFASVAIGAAVFLILLGISALIVKTLRMAK